LLLQRFGEIVGALTQLVKQAGVLDGDDGLRGKIAHKVYLLVAERPNLLAGNVDRADQRVFLYPRDAENGAIAAERGRGDDKWIAFEVSLFLGDIGYLRGSFGVGRAPERSIATRTDDRHARAGFGIGQRRVVHGGDSEGVALAQEERSKLGLAEARRVRQYGLG